jgi:hypothetical protein
VQPMIPHLHSHRNSICSSRRDTRHCCLLSAIVVQSDHRARELANRLSSDALPRPLRTPAMRPLTTDVVQHYTRPWSICCVVALENLLWLSSTVPPWTCRNQALQSLRLASSPAVHFLPGRDWNLAGPAIARAAIVVPG